MVDVYSNLGVFSGTQAKLAGFGPLRKLAALPGWA
jgi:hypothetical protein